MDRRSLSEGYEEFYEKLSVVPQQLDQEETASFASLTPAAESLDVLDMGCAEGALAVELALRGHEVTAADISQGHLDSALQLAQEHSVRIDLVKCNIEAGVSRFEGRTFDAIFFLNVLEHLKSPASGLENIRKLLKQDGVLWVQTPNACRVSRVLRHLIHRKQFANYYDPNALADLHFQVYDYMSLEQTLNLAGLEVTAVLPTRLTLPIFGRFRVCRPVFRLLSRLFPFLSDELLLSCKKGRPIDVDAQIDFWARTRGMGDG